MIGAAEHYIERTAELRRALHLVDDVIAAGLASDRWPLVLRLARALLRATDQLQPGANDPVVCHEVFGVVRRHLIELIAYAASAPQTGTASLVVSDTALAAIITLETTDPATVGTADRTLATAILDGVIWL